MMQKKHSVLIALVTSLMISTTAIASSVEITPTPSPTLAPHQQYELELAKHKIEMRAYLQARLVREQQLRVIANTFNQALRQANEDFRSAGRGATSKANFAAARALAALNRDKAVAALEPLMEEPKPPVKPVGYSAKGNKWKAPSPKADKKN
jgi:hypothetical protein